MKIKRVKTPTILQMEATECGAAVLGIILGYYGRYVPLEELRIECGVSRDGSKAINMLRAARRYGLKAQGARMDTEDLSQVRFPFIAFWEFNHFVVIEGYDQRKIYINDPATGPRTITYDEFDRSFTGVSLIMEPEANFKTGGKKTTLLGIIKPRVIRVKNALQFITVLTISLVIPGIIIPGFTKIFIDDILINQISGWLLPLLWGLFLTGLFRALLSYIQQRYLVRLDIKLTLTTSVQFVWHVLRLPFEFFSQRFSGDIQNRVAANDQVAEWIANGVSSSFVSLISMVFYAAVMFFYDWTLTLIGILVALTNAALLWVVGQYIQNNSYRFEQELGKLDGIEMNGLQSIETLKATSSEDEFFQRWAGYHAKTLNTQRKIHLYSQFLLIIPQLLTGLLTIVVLGLGGWRIMQGYLTIGSLIAFQSLLMSFNEPLMNLLGFGEKLQQLRGDLMRLEDVNKHPTDPRFAIVAKEDQSLQGKVEMRHIHFAYSPLDPPLIQDFNLLLNPGQQVAIVGISGSGKSTLAKIICGLYTPWSGEILWDNIPSNEIALDTFSQYRSFVDQEIFLFAGTVRQNLTLWDAAISNESIERAVKDAVLEPVLDTRLQALESPVANDGNNFSGGQRQQLEIARALAIEPKILILDEATSAMDTTTEKLVMRNIKKRGISLIVIAHRLSTIRDSDEIIVLDQGKIVERGVHAELLERKGHYYRLVQQQVRGDYA